MGLFAHFRRKKVIVIILLIITIPLWMTVLSYLFDFIIQAGRIIGTYIRVIALKSAC